MTEQLDLFQAPAALSATEAREIERFGKVDARTGLGLRNYYSDRLPSDQLEIYQHAFRAERMKDVANAADNLLRVAIPTRPEALCLPTAAQ
jgi:hypothetical protein